MRNLKLWVPRHISQEEKLARHISQYGAKVISKETVNGHEACLFDGGPHYDAKSEFPNGYYVSGYAVKKNRSWYIGFHYFDFAHDLDIQSSDRQRARLNTMLGYAHNHIETGKQGGMYE